MNKFPIQVFPSFVQDYINDLNKSLNFHKDFLSAAVMFSVSTVVGNRYKLIVKEGWEAAPIFWFACVGFPGTIKTHPIKTMVKPLSKIDKISKEFFDEEMRHWNPEAKPRQPKPIFKQLLISDYTIEALHHVHGYNTRGLGLYKDELNGFLKDMNKYRKGSDLEFWLESFNNGSYIVNRVSKDPILINDICINIIGTIQYEVLSEVISEYSGNGFIDRFLFTAPEQDVYQLNEHEADKSLTDKWDQFINHINNDSKYISQASTELIRMERGAFNKYREIDLKYVDIQKNDEENSAIKNYLSKMKTYVPRFALLLSLMRKAGTGDYIHVTEQDMLNAGLIAEYFIGTARDIFVINSTQSELKSIAHSLRSYTRNEKVAYLVEKGFSKTDVGRFFGISRQMVSKIISD